MQSAAEALERDEGPGGAVDLDESYLEENLGEFNIEGVGYTSQQATATLEYGDQEYEVRVSPGSSTSLQIRGEDGGVWRTYVDEEVPDNVDEMEHLLTEYELDRCY